MTVGRRRFLVLGLCLAFWTCRDPLTEPGAVRWGSVALSPVFSSTAGISGFGTVTNLHIVVRRFPTGEVLRDIVVPLDPDTDAFRIRLDSIPLQSVSQLVEVVYEFREGDVVLLEGSQRLLLRVEGVTQASSDSVSLQYVGPGRDAVRLTLSPRDTVLTFGDTLGFRVSAVTASGQTTAVYIAWRITDPVTSVNALGRLRAPGQRARAWAIARTPTPPGLADSTPITFVPRPSRLVAESGTPDLPVGSAASLAVRVLWDGDGLGVRGVPVRFRAGSGGGLVDTVVFSDIEGIARATARLGTLAGVQGFDASAPGVPALGLAVNAVAARLESLVVASGEGQTEVVGRVLPQSLVLRAADGFGNPVAGVSVAWRVEAGDGSLSTNSTATDALGLARVAWTLGLGAGRQAVTASVGSTLAVTFGATALAGPAAAMQVAGGDEQEAVVATELPQALAVTVTDAAGNPVTGQRVNFVVTAGGGSVFAGSNNTNDAGVAKERWTLGTSTTDAQRVEARAVDNETGERIVFAVFEATALPASPSALIGTAGDGQVGVVAVALPESVAVRLTDPYGNPVAGRTVDWSVTTGAGAVNPATSVTGSSGIAKTRWTLGTAAGSNQVTASAAGLPAVAFSARGTPGAIASVVVTPVSLEPATVGETRQFSAVASDAHGNVIADAAFAWSTSDPAVVTVDGNGLATAVGPGTAAITAESGGVVSGAVSLESRAVAQEVASVTVTPGAVTLNDGDTQQLTVVLRDADGNALSGVALTWESSDPSVVTVSDAGVIAVTGTGTATVTATVDGVSGSVSVTVIQTVATVELSPGPVTLTALDASQQLSAVARDANGNAMAAVFEWTSSNTQVATVSGAGVVTAVGNGTAVIRATAGGVSGSTEVTVAQAVALIQLAPPDATLTALGQTVQVLAQARDANGNVIANALFTWSSSDPGVATISGSGLVTAVGDGTATIDAASGGVSGTATVQVLSSDQTLAVSIDVYPTINLRSKGNLPAALLSTSVGAGDAVTFDARDAVVSSIRLDGAVVDRATLRDVDGDGDVDLALYFSKVEIQLVETSTAATLTGQTTSGVPFVGTGPVKVVQ